MPTGEEKGIPGFEAVIAIVGLLAVAYILGRKRQ
ncbi:MAG: PGF-CTERM sorting domain-containing protein [Methanomicrobia archaeon]|nr:PGF-CTERM sorting domain-containing protein [Methanomicrobia archaeon]